MTIGFAKYTYRKSDNTVLGVQATIDGVEMFVPLAPGNRHYRAIMEAVEAGELVIAEVE